MGRRFYWFCCTVIAPLSGLIAGGWVALNSNHPQAWFHVLFLFIVQPAIVALAAAVATRQRAAESINGILVAAVLGAGCLGMLLWMMTGIR